MLKNVTKELALRKNAHLVLVKLEQLQYRRLNAFVKIRLRFVSKSQ